MNRHWNVNKSTFKDKWAMISILLTETIKSAWKNQAKKNSRCFHNKWIYFFFSENSVRISLKQIQFSHFFILLFSFSHESRFPCNNFQFSSNFLVAGLSWKYCNCPRHWIINIFFRVLKIFKCSEEYFLWWSCWLVLSGSTY